MFLDFGDLGVSKRFITNVKITVQLELPWLESWCYVHYCTIQVNYSMVVYVPLGVEFRGSVVNDADMS